MDPARIRADYDSSRTLDLRVAGSRNVDGMSITDLTYAVPGRKDTSVRRAASIRRLGETAADLSPAILYVHWYEPSAGDSNRTQFEAEAQRMAACGAVCLCVETMWSDRDWFIKRTQADDAEDSILQTIELRRALDLLLSQPNVDPSRIAYVGHDFGAMYGILMGSIDARPTHYVLMAGTPRFPDWYLYYPRLEGPERDAYVESMTPLDPIARISSLSPAPLLFQFASKDPHVPVDRANAFFEAAGEPKEIQWYEAGHGLNNLAREARISWISKALRLPSSS